MGKSSLLNCLSGQDSAIVTDVAGTTRDVIREQVLVEDIPFCIFDTAGLQESKNIVEQEGIRRTWQEVEKADHVLWMVDDSIISEKLKHHAFNIPVTVIKNKIDLTTQKARIEERDGVPIVYLSVKTGEGIDLLKNYLKKLVSVTDQTEGIFIARRRHLDALNRAQSFLSNAKQQLLKHISSELVAEDLRQAQLSLSEITGEFTPEDLLDKIFSSFCIGK